MAIDVTLERVRATADLARLDLRDDEVAPLAAQLQKILHHIAALDDLDTDGVRGTSQVGVAASPLRDDVVVPGVDGAEALAQAPRRELGAFVVPQFVEE